MTTNYSKSMDINYQFTLSKLMVIFKNHFVAIDKKCAFDCMIISNYYIWFHLNSNLFIDKQIAGLSSSKTEDSHNQTLTKKSKKFNVDVIRVETDEITSR